MSGEVKVSRRSMLKWAGALAASAVAGIAIGVGADRLLTPAKEVEKTITQTTTSTATHTTTQTVTQPPSTTTITQTITQTPPPPPSLKPPLSPEIKQRVDAITKELIDRRAGENVVWTFVYPFWGGLFFPGLVGARVKDGVITGFETDDSIHPGMPREDEDWEAVTKHMIQARGGSHAVRARSYRNYLYRPERLLYPMKKVGPRGDPLAKFVRISWDEALETIAKKLLEVEKKYGPYSIAGWYTSPFGLASYIGGGVQGWGIASNESHNFAADYVYGRRVGVESMAGIFHSKLIVIWGAESSSTCLGGEQGYYIALAREKGIPVIVIDPRYSKDATALADQWIPIRPGTDVAMMLAVANVLFKEDLYDKEYVEKYVEPKGFQIWKNYVLGAIDGVDKTPEWAERICAVPAETIRAFARLYAKSKPCWLFFSWCGARQYQGENPARAAMYLQALTGNIGVLGGNSTYRQGGEMTVPGVTTPNFDIRAFTRIGRESAPNIFGTKPPKGDIAVLFKNYKWADAVLLREKYEKGELSKEEYHRIIGNPADNPTPNIKFIWFHTNLLNQTPGINKQLEAIKKTEMCVALAWHVDQPTAMAADIILPRAEAFEEDPCIYTNAAGGWSLSRKVIKWPGEVRSILWILMRLAERLGVSDQFAPELAGITEEEAWDRKLEEGAKKAYEEWAAKNNYNVPWEEFLKKPIYRKPLETPAVAYRDQIEKGERFYTASGKIEFYSEYLATTDLNKTKYGGFIKPYAEYVHQKEGYFDPKVTKYPLYLISPHSRYRMHSWQCNDPMLQSDVYRHSVWVSAVDAAARGIKDGDLVRVYNDAGEVVLPAYVTHMIVPGTVMIWEGGWFAPNKAGIDRGGSPNTLCYDGENPSGQWPFTVLVEVEKF